MQDLGPFMLRAWSLGVYRVGRRMAYAFRSPSPASIHHTRMSVEKQPQKQLPRPWWPSMRVRRAPKSSINARAREGKRRNLGKCTSSAALMKPACLTSLRAQLDRKYPRHPVC